MPEGDTVFQAAQRLQAALGTAALDVVDLRVPRWATVDLRGARHVGTLARGKHLLTRLDHDSGEWTLHTHLRMEGAWHVYRGDERWRRPALQARVVLRTDAPRPAVAVGFSLGEVDLLARSAEEEVVGHLGPDLLAPWGDEQTREALQRLVADGERGVWAALLDQRNLAGVGNVYANELCFLLGLHPLTPIAHIERPERLVSLAHRLLVANRSRSVRVTTGDTRRGRELWVYRRDARPCRRCGTPIAVGMVTDERPERGERATYHCPRCQPASRAVGTSG